MSRAFVKESDSEAADSLPERPQSPHTNYVTPAGLSRLQQAVRELMERKARLAGEADMSAQQQIKQVERDLRYFEERVERAVLVEPASQPDERVHFGATVELLDGQGLKTRFTIVGEDEADAAEGKVSWVSPLANALMDAQVGDMVTWKRPAGDKELEILAIHKDGGPC